MFHELFVLVVRENLREVRNFDIAWVILIEEVESYLYTFFGEERFVVGSGDQEFFEVYLTGAVEI